jgi:hypothetical protein
LGLKDNKKENYTVFWQFFGSLREILHKCALKQLGLGYAKTHDTLTIL